MIESILIDISDREPLIKEKNEEVEEKKLKEKLENKLRFISSSDEEKLQLYFVMHIVMYQIIKLMKKYLENVY